jgi:hypothetical protein
MKTIVLATVTLGLAIAVSSAQAPRQQVPRFEPDPLWSEALPNKWVNGQSSTVRPRFPTARKRRR